MFVACWAVLVLHRYLSFYDDSLLVAQGLYGVEHACGLFYAAVVAHAANPSWRIEVHVDGLVGESSLYSVAYLLRAVLVVARVSAGVCLHPIAVYLVSAHPHLFARVYYGDVQAVAIVAQGVILLCGLSFVRLVLARLFRFAFLVRLSRRALNLGNGTGFPAVGCAAVGGLGGAFVGIGVCPLPCAALTVNQLFYGGTLRDGYNALRLWIASAQMVGKGLRLHCNDGANPSENNGYQTFHCCGVLRVALGRSGQLLTNLRTYRI